MPLDPAFNKALEDMKRLSPYACAAKSGAIFESGKFSLPLFNRVFLIHFPEIRFEEVGKESIPPQWLQLLLMHYLLTANGAPVADEWITYRHLPGAYLFEMRFANQAIKPLLRAFANDIEGFCQASLSLGGTPMTRTGDAAFRFMTLPRIPMASILYLGDDEVQPSVSILFDAAAPNYLPTEDLSILGGYLSAALRSHKRAA